jgi:hypothetical protein
MAIAATLVRSGDRSPDCIRLGVVRPVMLAVEVNLPLVVVQYHEVSSARHLRLRPNWAANQTPDRLAPLSFASESKSKSITAQAATGSERLQCMSSSTALSPSPLRNWMIWIKQSPRRLGRPRRLDMIHEEGLAATPMTSRPMIPHAARRAARCVRPSLK